jgi:protein-L-isoaspartate(D-aspartate) O-methyltransferase
MNPLEATLRRSCLALVCLIIIQSGCTGRPAPALTAVVSEAPLLASAPTGDKFYDARINMVERTIEARGVADPDVLRAMRSVPRHLFVQPKLLEQAYADHPLPIGYGQTISQPYIVAWMTELLELKEGEKVLEIGTGSGYQAAVLAELGFVDVYSIEIVPELAESAATRLEELGFDEVSVKQGDGYFGWPERAPFDAIIVTAAPDHLPAPLAGQLKEGGRIVIPIGPPGGYQSLWKFVKENGELTAYNLGGVAFVPFTGPGIEQRPADSTPAP